AFEQPLAAPATPLGTAHEHPIQPRRPVGAWLCVSSVAAAIARAGSRALAEGRTCLSRRRSPPGGRKNYRRDPLAFQLATDSTSRSTSPAVPPCRTAFDLSRSH